ncbi:hypothetical protein [Jiangella asiatica]|uniref:Type II toxin-antitoxin system RelE/ParE family toxin n=1 Tax=Jiangella asiatica TaxID=2530372 RepID=A0A4R5CT82_9ACTN|nr:hypothetical protein [Jiangella asiatica]TDE02807.1 hypothetical protein E1269_21170 [Jiangella asiatica]
MEHQVRIEPEASAELEDAIRWYDKQHAGLGADFLGAVDATIAHVDRWPDSAPAMLHVAAEIAVSRAPVQRFPYGVVYLVLDDTTGSSPSPTSDASRTTGIAERADDSGFRM